MQITDLKELDNGDALVTFHMSDEEIRAAISFALFTWITQAAELEIKRNEVDDNES